MQNVILYSVEVMMENFLELMWMVVILVKNTPYHKIIPSSMIPVLCQRSMHMDSPSHGGVLSILEIHRLEPEQDECFVVTLALQILLRKSI